MTAKQYDSIDVELDALNIKQPEGRLYHASAPTNSGWLVTDVWESSNKLDVFTEKLLPILIKNKVELLEPKIYSAHSVIPGK